MSMISLDINRLRLQPPPRQNPIQNSQEIDDRVSKTFSLTLENQNPGQFYRDVQGKERVLIYNHQSIYHMYKKSFDQIVDLTETQKQVDPDENQDLYDSLQDQIDDVTKELNEKAKTDFDDFLKERLGDARKHLSPEISYRFSQVALLSLIGQVNDHTTKKYNGFFTDGISEESCNLHIPEQGAVTIEATTRGIYQNFIQAGKFEKENRPVELTASAIYTIPLKGKTKAQVDFTLKELT